jgi:hypothetical protein
MITTIQVQGWLAALAASLVVAAGCGGKSEPPPVAPEPAPAEAATPVEPAPPEPEPEPDPAQAQAELVAAERSAYELAAPVFQKHCARCHAKGGKKARRKTLEHFDMTTYPFAGHHADDITSEIREVLAIGGEGKPTMPFDKPGAVQGAELELIADWAEAYDKAHASPEAADPG